MARAYEVLVFDGPLPPLGVMLGQSKAEANFADLHSNPRRAKEREQHCAAALDAWHERTGTPRRRPEP